MLKHSFSNTYVNMFRFLLHIRDNKNDNSAHVRYQIYLILHTWSSIAVFKYCHNPYISYPIKMSSVYKCCINKFLNVINEIYARVFATGKNCLSIYIQHQKKFLLINLKHNLCTISTLYIIVRILYLIVLHIAHKLCNIAQFMCNLKYNKIQYPDNK